MAVLIGVLGAVRAVDSSVMEGEGPPQPNLTGWDRRNGHAPVRVSDLEYGGAFGYTGVTSIGVRSPPALSRPREPVPLKASRMQKNAQAAEQNEGLAHLTGERAIVIAQRLRSVEDDATLAGRLSKGDQTAAEELVNRYYERIYLFLRAVGHNRQTSEDLVQETFLRAWHHIGQLRNGKALNGWLFRIASNVSKLHHRRGRDRAGVDLDSIEPQTGGASGPDGAGEREQMGRLHEAVARLPWKLRQAIVLHYMEQLTISEAADAAGIRPGTLKSRLNRGLEALRQQVMDK